VHFLNLLEPQTIVIFIRFFAGVCQADLRSLIPVFVVTDSVAKPNHFYAAPAPDPAAGKNFDAAPDPAAPAPAAPAAPAPAPTLLYSKENFLKRTEV
jgi:hypothetical protein